MNTVTFQTNTSEMKNISEFLCKTANWNIWL